MALRHWFMACSGTATDRMEGLCARLRDAVHDDDNENAQEHRVCGCGNNDAIDDMEDVGHGAALWNDLTLSAMEPSIPQEISVPAPDDAAAIATMYSSLEDDCDSLVGLEILDLPDDERQESLALDHQHVMAMMGCAATNPWRSSTECSWTYSTASSHGKDLAEFMKYDDGSSYSSLGKPPRPPTAATTSSRSKARHKKTKSGGTASTSTTTASWSRTSTVGAAMII